MRRTGTLLGFTLLLAILAISLAAQPRLGKIAPAVSMQTPEPGPEMQRLGFFVGDWNLQGEYLKTAMTGEGAKQTGWYKAHLGPGGFSVIADFEADSELGQEIRHALFSWDPKKEAYSTVTVGNFAGVVTGNAHWEGESLVVQSELEMDGSSLHLRARYSPIAGKTIQIEESVQVGNAPYQLMWKATATRK